MVEIVQETIWPVTDDDVTATFCHPAKLEIGKLYYLRERSLCQMRLFLLIGFTDSPDWALMMDLRGDGDIDRIECSDLWELKDTKGAPVDRDRVYFALTL